MTPFRPWPGVETSDDGLIEGAAVPWSLGVLGSQVMEVVGDTGAVVGAVSVRPLGPRDEDGASQPPHAGFLTA